MLIPRLIRYYSTYIMSKQVTSEEIVNKVFELKKFVNPSLSVKSSHNRFVQIHIHLDGSVKVNSLWDIIKRRNINVGANTLEELKKMVIPKVGLSLVELLKPFPIINRIIGGDEQALKTISREFVQTMSNEGCMYVEVRYSPHLMRGSQDTNSLSPDQVVEYVEAGLKEGVTTCPNITIRSILCCLRDHPEWSMEVVDLAHKYKHLGIVGIDLAGDEFAGMYEDHAPTFVKAKELGIHRTVHAGESGPPEHVVKALDVLHAERIGHGYAVALDDVLLKRVIKDRVHLELCPISSVFTGNYLRSPAIAKFITNGVLFSISTDDPEINTCELRHEHLFCQTIIGCGVEVIAHAQKMALEAAFIGEEEKNELRKKLTCAYSF